MLKAFARKEIAGGATAPAWYGLVYHCVDRPVSVYAAFPLNYLWRVGLWFWWRFRLLLNRPSWIDSMTKTAYAKGYWAGREIEKTLRGGNEKLGH